MLDTVHWAGGRGNNPTLASKHRSFVVFVCLSKQQKSSKHKIPESRQRKRVPCAASSMMRRQLPSTTLNNEASVNLSTIEGKPLESLKKLEKRGVKVSSCGTVRSAIQMCVRVSTGHVLMSRSHLHSFQCLDAMNVRDKLKVGDVGSMAKAVARHFNPNVKIIAPC